MTDEIEGESSGDTPKGAGEGLAARSKRWALFAVILALAASTFYLLAERNSRFYFLSTEGERLVVSRGAWFPAWKSEFHPEDPILAEAYAPLALPAGIVVSETRFNERQDLDQALFDYLLSWAEPRILADEPESLQLGGSYLARAGLLQGISSEQAGRLRSLRAEVAFAEGRIQLGAVLAELAAVNEKLRLASDGQTLKGREALQVMDRVSPAMKLLSMALQQMRGEGAWAPGKDGEAEAPQPWEVEARRIVAEAEAKERAEAESPEEEGGGAAAAPRPAEDPAPQNRDEPKPPATERIGSGTKLPASRTDVGGEDGIGKGAGASVVRGAGSPSSQTAGDAQPIPGNGSNDESGAPKLDPPEAGETALAGEGEATP